MKATLTPDTADTSQAVAHQPATNGIAMPAVSAQQPIEEDTLHEEPAAKGPIEQPVMMDLDDDEEDEPHLLFINLKDGHLWLHSDEQTLELFLVRKRKKSSDPGILKLLDDIEKAAAIVHAGKYGTKKAANRINSKGQLKTQQRVAPTKQDRDEAIRQLVIIGKLLQQLNRASVAVMKKMRPPSNKQIGDKKTIGSDIFCAKVRMAPLSLLPRNDGIIGSPPYERTSLFDRLTQRINYKRGHMLNEHLHGPGTNDNLVPISTAFNGVMKNDVESATKKIVNADNKVVSFEAEPLDWGMYQGFYNGSFADEKVLPAKFRFLVKRMKRIPGTDGSNINDWQETGTVEYQKTLAHTPPSAADVVKGTIAPVVQTFSPGYYRSAGGKLEQAPNLNYYLSGHYLVNSASFAYLYAPLGLDAGALTPGDHDLKVTTEFQLPPGHSLEVIPVKGLKYIYNNKILKTTTPDGQSFVIADAAVRLKNIDEYGKEKVKVAAAQEQQKKLEEEAKEKKKQQSTTGGNDTWIKGRNNSRMLEAEMKFKEEGRKNGEVLDEEFRQLLIAEQEKILSKAREGWEKDNNLYYQTTGSLVSPLLAQLMKYREQLLRQQTEKEAKARAATQWEGFVAELQRVLTSEVENHYLPMLAEPWRKEEFMEKAKRVIGSHYSFWQGKAGVFRLTDRDKMLAAARGKLDDALKAVQALTSQPSNPAKRKHEPEPKPEIKPTLKSKDDEEEEEEDGRSTEEDITKKKARTGPGAFKLNTVTSGNTGPRQPDVPRFQPPPVQPSSVIIDQVIKTARDFLGRVTQVGLESRSDPFVTGQLAMLDTPLDEFIRRPNERDWNEVNNILLNFKATGDFPAHIEKWIFIWTSIGPSRQ